MTTSRPSLGTVFDINVYCNAYYNICGQDGKSVLPVEACSADKQLELDDRTRVDQACWAMLRLVDVDWVWEAEPPQQSQSLIQSLRQGIRSLKENVLQPQCNHDAVADGAERILAELTERSPSLTADEATALRMRYVNAISAVRVLESDAYYSYGAFAHVVLGMQANGKIALHDMDYVASFFDNLGFLCMQRQQQPASSNINMSALKYLDRCAKALAAIEIMKPELIVIAAVAADAMKAKKANKAFPLNITWDSLRSALAPISHALVNRVAMARSDGPTPGSCEAKDSARRSRVGIVLTRGPKN